MKNLVNQDILINLRTYVHTALVLYINDHLNNFVHLYIVNETYVVFMFNDGDEIKEITVWHPGMCINFRFFKSSFYA